MARASTPAARICPKGPYSPDMDTVHLPLSQKHLPTLPYRKTLLTPQAQPQGALLPMPPSFQTQSHGRLPPGDGSAQVWI